MDKMKSEKNADPASQNAEEVKRLTSSAYWGELPIPEAKLAPARPRSRWIPEKALKAYRTLRSVHSQRILHEVLLAPLLSGMRGGRFLEIGSAPGDNGLAFHRYYGLIPYGLEYSGPRVQAQRQLYRLNGLPEDWVIQGDFFDDGVLDPLRASFDVVASFGFIEHFDDPAVVLARHLALLRPGGLLVVGVPNLGRGSLNGWLTRRYNPAVYALHNIETCGADGFRRLFPPPGCEPVFCGPLGGVHAEVRPDARRQSRRVSRALEKAWPWVNAMNHLCVGTRLSSFPRTSATWLMIARKKTPPGAASIPRSSP